MAEVHYFRESSGAVSSEINLVSVEKRAADWLQSVAGGQIVLKDGAGTSVTIANAGVGEVFRGPFRAIVSSAGKVRYGTGNGPDAFTTAGAGAAASASAAATSASNAAASASAAAITNLDVTLIAGTKTQASGGTLTTAKIVGTPRLKTLNATPALGVQILVSISGNSVVCTAYKADGTAEIADVATYTVSLAGVT